MHHVRDAVHRGFKRNRDLLLDLLGGDSRPLGDDLNVVVGHVRIGFDGKPVERNDAPDEQQDRKGEHQKAVVQGVVDEAAYHLLLHRGLKIQGISDHLLTRAEGPR